MKHYRFALLMIILSIVMCACQKKYLQGESYFFLLAGADPDK